MPRGVDIFAALARTKGDIHYPSDESLDGHLSVLFPYRSELQGYWNNVVFHFLGMPLYVAGKYSLTINNHKKQYVLKVDRLNYIMISNKSSPVLFLTSDEDQNLHVKMIKN